MKTSILSFFAAGAMLLASSTPAIAAHDSIITPEQRIERSAQELAAESIELATQEVKKARQKSSKLRAEIDERLKDTIINGKKLKESRYSDDYAWQYNNRLQSEQNIINKSFEFVEKLGQGILIFVSVIIILIIIGMYISRRQKYKIIEKAIENNYPLPPGFISKNTRTAPATTVQHIHYSSAQAQSGNIPAGSKKIVREYNVSDWANFRSGIKWCAWGIAFLLFFIIKNAPVWVFALIPLITGIGKLFAAYQIQKASNNAKVSTSTTSDDTSVPTPPPFGNNEDNTSHN
jgi:hypothetical protein